MSGRLFHPSVEMPEEICDIVNLVADLTGRSFSEVICDLIENFASDRSFPAYVAQSARERATIYVNRTLALKRNPAP